MSLGNCAGDRQETLAMMATVMATSDRFRRVRRPPKPDRRRALELLAASPTAAPKRGNVIRNRSDHKSTSLRQSSGHSSPPSRSAGPRDQRLSPHAAQYNGDRN